MINEGFWRNKKVLVTGHTGFKGSWLCLWLHLLGCKVTGYALTPPTNPSLFELCTIDELVDSKIADIRDLQSLKVTILDASPDIVIHMAAQPLVRDSYRDPVETYTTNVTGTVNILECVRSCKSIKAVVNVTTDKCYENKEWIWAYRENEPLGGYDPYSSSKACSELVTSSYRSSFFNPEDYQHHGVGLASARAGNVIGGGDWAVERLVPDCVRALINGEKIAIRNPGAIRPWQHVLEPLSGYLLLVQKLYNEGPQYAEGWNFGPDDKDAKPVAWVVKKISEKWGIDSLNEEFRIEDNLHEANYLKLDCSKAKYKLGWYPKWDLSYSLDKVVEWAQAYKNKKDMRTVCFEQIEEYCSY